MITFKIILHALILFFLLDNPIFGPSFAKVFYKNQCKKLLWRKHKMYRSLYYTDDIDISFTPLEFKISGKNSTLHIL